VEKIEGWHPDLFGSHEFRWFSDGRPTSRVRDGGVESHDEVSEPPINSDSPLSHVQPPITTSPTSARRKRRRLIVGIGVAVVVVVAVGTAFALTRSTPANTTDPPKSTPKAAPSASATKVTPTSTATKVFAPWTAGGVLAPGIQVAAHLNDGSCTIGSLADGVPNGRFGFQRGVMVAIRSQLGFPA
jgi:hypothetical protein